MKSPFPSHNNNNNDKGKEMIMSSPMTDIKGDDPMQPEGKPNLDRMAQRGKVCLSLNIFVMKWTSIQGKA